MTSARILANDYNMQPGSKGYNAATVGYTNASAVAKSRKVGTNYRGNCDGCTRKSRIDYVFISKAATSGVGLGYERGEKAPPEMKARLGPRWPAISTRR